VEEQEEHQMYLPCPYENCRGYAMRNGVCGVCSQKVCLSCRMQKEDEHKCNPDDVASVELIKKDSRPCPQCRAPIHRYEGCPQMFCTVCHAQFHWTTGALLKNIHNPHLVEWEQNNHRICGGDVNLSIFHPVARAHASTYYNRALHVTRYVIPSLRDTIQPIHERMRRMYIQHAVTDKEWVRETRVFNRRQERVHELINVFELFHDVVVSVLANRPDQWNETAATLDMITSLCNKKFDEIGQRYNIKVQRYKWVA